MSGCGGCKGSCKTDSNKKKEDCCGGHSKKGKILKDIDISEYLRPKPKYGPIPDNTPLERKCEHWGYTGYMKRYQCLRCIRTWVYAVGIKTTLEKIEEYKKTNFSTVAIERMEMAIEEYKHDIPIKQLEEELSEIE